MCPVASFLLPDFALIDCLIACLLACLLAFLLQNDVQPLFLYMGVLMFATDYSRVIHFIFNAFEEACSLDSGDCN